MRNESIVKGSLTEPSKLLAEAERDGSFEKTVFVFKEGKSQKNIPS